MTWETILVAVILVLILGGASLYIYKAKKRGVKCIGCPDGATCSGHCSGCSGNCGCCGGRYGYKITKAIDPFFPP